MQQENNICFQIHVETEFSHWLTSQYLFALLFPRFVPLSQSKPSCANILEKK